MPRHRDGGFPGIPPMQARHLMEKEKSVAGERRGAPGRAAILAAAPPLHIRFPPAFHVREAVFMVFNVDHPPAPQPPFLFFLSFF